MDDVSHMLWSYLFFYWTGHPWLAILFGVLPDLLSFAPVVIYRMFRPSRRKEAFEQSYKRIPQGLRDYAEKAYDVTHNLFAAGIITAIAIATGAWWLLAWTLHVLMDIPTHSKGFYATPMFWPVSDFKMDGIPWTDKRVMIPNVIALAAGYAWLFVFIR